MIQNVIYCCYTQQTETLATKIMNELRHAVCFTTTIVANMYTSSVEFTTLPWLDASIRLYIVSKAALENVGMYQEIKMLWENDDKSKNVFFLSSSILGRMSNKNVVKYWVSQSCYDVSMFFDRLRLYSVIYEKLYGQPKHHSYLLDSVDQYWHGMWILACHFDNFNDLFLSKEILEKSAKASNMFALNYVGYSLCCGAVPFDIDEERGLEMMTKAATMGHPIGMINAGKILWQRGEYQKAVHLLQNGLSDVEDDGGAYLLLAECYAQGLGVSKNPDKASRCTIFSKALHMKYYLNHSLGSNHLWRNLALNTVLNDNYASQNKIS